MKLAMVEARQIALEENDQMKARDLKNKSKNFIF